jgi:hypothetical protein
MIGQIIAVGMHQGRWMYVTKVEEHVVHGRVWKPTAGKWTQANVWYARNTIDKKQPSCPRPMPPWADK